MQLPPDVIVPAGQSTGVQPIQHDDKAAMQNIATIFDLAKPSGMAES
ncbi:MAG TPA: hypothetical protein VJR89_09200 [Polyangiales bacterium]|nr:hypothetical protein [Polyangiales bacterium]